MAEEKIFTQADLDEKIKERLERENDKHTKALNAKQAEIDKLTKEKKELEDKYASFDTDKAQLQKTIDELNAKVKKNENDSAKTAIAAKLGLDAKAIEFIQGETEEEIKASAEKLKGIVGNFVPPLKSYEENNTDKITDALNSMNLALKGNG